MGPTPRARRGQREDTSDARRPVHGHPGASQGLKPSIPVCPTVFDYERLKDDLLDWIYPEPVTARERELMAAIEPGEYEIYAHKLDAALDEARTVFIRTGVSSMLKSGDLVVGIQTRDGDLVNASCGTYVHGPIAQLPVKFIIDRYLEGDSNLEINPGDIFYTNEALAGGLHNPDQIAIMPVFVDDELIAWASAALHQPETGAIEPGGMPQGARTRYDEGMRLTPIKIAEDHEIRDDLMDMMVNFISRAPQMQEIDVRARCTAVDLLRRRVQAIAEETSVGFVHGLFRKLIADAEAGARSRIESWTDGTYRSVGFYDNIGEEEALMRIAVAVTKRDDELVLDFSGTSPEAGSYNSYAHGVAGYVSTFLFPYVFYDLPVSTGVFAPFTIEVPDGSLLNASPEASVANCVIVGSIVFGQCHDAFARMLYRTDPDRVAAAPDTHEGAGNFAGQNRYGVAESDMFAYTLNTMGGGARPDMDGIDAHGFSFGPWGKATNLEDREQDGMFLGLSRRFLADTGGYGKYRGGSGTQNVNVVTSDAPVFVQGVGKGSKIPSDTGLFGGYAEASLLGVRITDTDVLDRLAEGEAVPRDIRELVTERVVDGTYHFESVSHGSRMLSLGDIVVKLISGGGGIGDPLERDPEAVRDDVVKGVVSRWAAEHVYGVALDGQTVDADRTAELREETRRWRRDHGRPYADFIESWSATRPPEDVLGSYGAWPDPAPRRVELSGSGD